MKRIATGIAPLAARPRGRSGALPPRRLERATVTFDVLADDVLALIDALGIDRPLIAGSREGALHRCSTTAAGLNGEQ
jgi:pimeloyl-ACP methyl ester carboxylesterase